MTVKSTTTSARLTHCTCGCGNLVRRAKSLYVPGHDARHAGLVAREAVFSAFAERMVNDHLPTPALRAKALAMVTRLQEVAAAKAAKQEARDTKATAKSVQPVKVGRWTYPAMLKDGALLRNTKRDGSGEWVAA